jgi:glycosyltransferase involved in cell wall biosynthesis
MQELTIAYSTIGERINELNIPPKFNGINYLIIHQSQDLAQELDNNKFSRDDIQYFKIDSIGLSRSRNSAIEKCNTKYIYFCDDDVQIKFESLILALDEIIKYKLDIFTGQFQFNNGKFPKKYKKYRFIHNRISIGSVSSIEIIANVAELKSKNIHFNEDFGLGSKYPSGEEYLFLYDCLVKDLKVSYSPLCIAIHPEISSGLDYYSTPNKIIAKRKIIIKAFGKFSIIFLILFWLKKIYKPLKLGFGKQFTKYLFGFN